MFWTGNGCTPWTYRSLKLSKPSPGGDRLVTTLLRLLKQTANPPGQEVVHSAKGGFKTGVVCQNDSADRLDRAVVFHFLCRVVVHVGSLLFESAALAAPMGRSRVRSRINRRTVLLETSPPRYRSVPDPPDGCTRLLAADSAVKRSPVAKRCVRAAVGGGGREQGDHSQHPEQRV